MAESFGSDASARSCRRGQRPQKPDPPSWHLYLLCSCKWSEADRQQGWAMGGEPRNKMSKWSKLPFRNCE
eukprot:3877904-Amphidinium_carterae.1